MAHNLTTFINMQTMAGRSWQPAATRNNRSTYWQLSYISHISQVQRACKYSQQDNWQHNSLRERERESAHEGYIRVPPVSSAWGKVSNSAHLFPCSHHSSRLCCCCHEMLPLLKANLQTVCPRHVGKCESPSCLPFCTYVRQYRRGNPRQICSKITVLSVFHIPETL